MIVGVGVDVVDIARFMATLERAPRLREKLFTPPERDLAPSSLAARFAAKEALAKAREVVTAAQAGTAPAAAAPGESSHEVVGSAWGAAISSFLFFASGAIIPVLPWIFGMSGVGAVALALGLVGVALLGTGAMVGLLSGASPLKRGLRQLAIGFGAAAVTYVLGLLFGVSAA